MDKESKKIQKDFQQRPFWIFFTVMIGVIGAAPSFSGLVLDFFPQWVDNKGCIKMLFIIICFLILCSVYWIKKLISRDKDKLSEDEKENLRTKKNLKKVKWLAFTRELKNFPLNVLTLRIIPLCVCWVIKRFTNKKYQYNLEVFYFPKPWGNDNYDTIIRKFFKTMFRVHILTDSLQTDSLQSYEVKFQRDFQFVEVRRTEDGENFGAPINKPYKEVFSKDDFKHIRLFTWCFPFGLYWNLRRLIKNLTSFKSLKN